MYNAKHGSQRHAIKMEMMVQACNVSNMGAGYVMDNTQETCVGHVEESCEVVSRRGWVEDKHSMVTHASISLKSLFRQLVCL